jgi:hypothetical protein
MKACKHLAVEPDKLGRFIQRKDWAYKCKAPIPDLPAMPACVDPIKITVRSVYSAICADCPLREER